MGSLTNFAENAMVNHVSTSIAYTPAATVYLAFATADPGEAATGASMSEVANANGYARTAITFGAAAARRVTQSGAVTFPEATGGWGTVTHWAVVTSATYGAGDCLAYGALNASFTVVAGNIRTVPTANVYVEITASTGPSNYVANGFLDRMFRNQVFTVSANWVGLTTATVVDSNTGSTITEVSGGSYARVEINEAGGASPSWTTISGGATQNEEDVVFPDPTGSWGTITSMVICDASTLGNLLWYGNDVVDQLVGVETTAILFAVGDLDVSQS